MKKIVIGLSVLLTLVACKARETPVHYNSCKEAARYADTPLYKGESGYSTRLDRDNDGVACDK